MNDRSFERRAHAWLELGPTQVPTDAVQAVLTRIESISQERPHARLGGRALPAARRELLAAAAAIALAVVAGGAFLLRPAGPEVAATPSPSSNASQRADSLLRTLPVTVLIEASGGPETEARDIALGDVTINRLSVLAVSCSGAPSIEITSPVMEGTVECLEEPMLQEARGGFGTSTPVVVSVAPGVTWHVAIGEFAADFATEPEFEPIPPTEGWNVLADTGLQLVMPGRGTGAAVQAPAGATQVAVVVRCEGASVVTIIAGANPAKELPCTSSGSDARVELPATGGAYLDVGARTSSVAWISVYVEANASVAQTWPSAPPMPPDVAVTPWVEADVDYLVFGTLGADTQTQVRLANGQAGHPSGDLVPVAAGDTDAARPRLELWSISRAERERILVDVGDKAVMESWLDGTHEQVFYGVYDDAARTMEIRRVGTDGTGEELLLTVGPGVNAMRGRLAADHSSFVAVGCIETTDCTAWVIDAATGAVETITDGPEPICELRGIAGSQLVVTSGPGCAEGSLQTKVIPIEGGTSRAVTGVGPEGVAVEVDGVVQFAHIDTTGETRTTVSLLDLASGSSRQVATFEHEMGMGPRLSAVELPRGEWILLASVLADTPSSNGLGRHVPVLLNVVTGEQIELVNLPHTRE